ncbi:hypothetical protein B0H15DRAFT_957713 [Mycena belliarum]|uniref:Uncharacterized protein n=1 Tax=Mycena belliarum TaxID=1033014 RepID=A0AAD6TMD0_9AGAR|nr:hypothetical protein B0H15DRAFT_957713 [Mycena belliae]
MEMPPTTYALPQTHRAHLIRSTRKLGALLGETPLLLDTSPAHTHGRSLSASSTSSIGSDGSIASKRSGRVFSSSPGPPRSSSLAVAEPRSPNAPRTTPTARPRLYLRLAAARPVSLLPASPLTPRFASATGGGSASPRTPTFSPDLAAARRRRMAKLVRTLGADVPPALVFAAARKDERAPVRDSPDNPWCPADGLASPTREAAAMCADDDDDEWIDIDCPPSAYQPHAIPFPTFPSASRAPSRADDARFLARHVRVDFDLAADSPATTPSSDCASDSDSRSESRYAGGHGVKASTHRREQGWSGEWSAGTRGVGMADVVRGLRGLRVK